jgi:hypothetical protein
LLENKPGSPNLTGEPAVFHFSTVVVSSHYFPSQAKVISYFAEGYPREVISVSNLIQAIQAIDSQTQTQQTTLPAKSQQTTPQSALPQDKVTISASAQQTLANSAKPSGGGK